MALLPALAAVALLGANPACTSFSTEASPEDAAVADGGPTIPPVACGPSIDLQTDGQSCGRCGHSCLGGACAKGACQPTILASSGPDPVVDVVVDATRVIWTTTMRTAWSDDGDVLACPKAGCGGTPGSLGKLATGTLASDGKSAYVSGVYGTRQIDRITTSLEKIVALSGHGSAVRLQVEGPKLHFLALGEPPNIDGGSGTIYSWDGTTETNRGAYVGRNLFHFVVVGDRAYLANSLTIYTCALGSCDVLAPFYDDGGNDGVTALGSDGDRIFWGTSVGTVLGCKAEGSQCAAPATMLVKGRLGTGHASALTVASGTLYVATSGEEIFACDPKGICPPEPLVKAQGKLFDGNESTFGHTVTADDVAVYWSESAGGMHHIMRLAR